MDLYNVPDVFHSAIRDIRDKKHLEYVFKGGRGSTKSSTVAMMIVELLRNHHDIHAVVCRKVGNTIKDSVYNKIKNGVTFVINKIKGVKKETYKNAAINTIGVSGGIASGVTAMKEKSEAKDKE